MGARRKTGPSTSTRSLTKAKSPPSRRPSKSPSDPEKLVDELQAQNRELREKQEEIEETRRRYLDLYDFAPIGYFVFGREGKIVEVNLTGAEMVGLPKNRLIGMPFYLFLNREFTLTFLQHLKKVFSGETRETCELKLNPRFRKTTMFVSIESRAINIQGSATCRSAVIDITERKLTEEELSRVRAELLQQNARLRRLSAGLLEAHEEERSRVAYDVHDSFGSILAVIKHELKSVLGKEENNSALKNALEHLDAAIQDATRIQAALRPSVLDDLGLLPALDMLYREFQENHPHLRVEKQYSLEEAQVPGVIKAPVYRMAQEALKNIVQHSKADSITISLAKTDSSVDFVIRDNGKGFKAEEALSSGKGVGLSSMRERAVLSGGIFHIESAPGKGTTLRFSWPWP